MPPLYVLNFTSNPPLSSCDFPLYPPLWFPNHPLQVTIAQSLSALISFTGVRLESYPGFPQTLTCDKFGHFQRGFFNIANILPDIVCQFQDFLIHREIWRPNCEIVS